MFSRSRSLAYGFTLPWRALRTILAHPALMAWSAVPIALTLTLYIYVISALQKGAREFLQQYFINLGWNPNSWSTWLLALLANLLIFLIGAFTFSFVASIVASPFNDLLAEGAEKWASPPLPAVPSSSLGHKLRLLAIDLGKAVAATGATFLAILLSWVPVLNVLAFVAAFLLLTFQYISYPQTRRGLGVRAGVAFLWRHFYCCAGFGAALSFLFAVPVVSSLALPLAVVGGTLLVARAPGSADLRPLK